ncbi:sirohydrochlorin chelatase [Thalassiella azotivora]
MTAHGDADGEPGRRGGHDGPVLVGCAHGTRDPAGRRAVAGLLLDVAALRPDLDVRPAFVDVQPPEVSDVVARVTRAGGTAVVVPLLLSTGYHTNVDVARAVADAGPGARAAGTLGPDPRLVDLLLERLAGAGAGPGDGVVVAAAGSSDPQAAADVDVVVRGLAARRPGPVLAGFGASARPSVPEAVERLRDSGCGRVVVASYLLAPGFFHDRLAGAGADAVTAPLAPAPGLARIVLDRYEAALTP